MKTTGVLAAGAAAALLACDAGLPGGVRYELVAASDSALPTVLRIDQGCVHRLHGGTVEFDGEGSYTSTYDIRIMCRDTVIRPELGARGRFSVRNDTAFFVDSAGVDAGKGRLTADSLVVQGPLRRLVYLRR